jgi:hypothetical protein
LNHSARDPVIGGKLRNTPMNLDQLLAIVADLSMLTTKGQLEERRSQCQAAYDQLKGASDKSEREKAEMLLAAIARIQNKTAAIRFSQRPEAQRALKAAASIPRERFTATRARAHL